MSDNSARCIPQQQVPTLEPRASDEQLITHICASGSKRKLAFDMLMQRHQRWMFQRCLFYIGNYHDAEDTVQEIMLRVYRGLKSFEGRASFRGWLNSIIYNQCITFVTRCARLELAENIVHSIQLLEKLRYLQCTAWFDERAQATSTLALMPQRAREILYLRFFRDRSLEEIARSLDISLSAAKMRLYRALELFRVRYSCGDASAKSVGKYSFKT